MRAWVVSLSIAASVLAGCVTPPRPQIAPEIGRDTATFSLAYARAANNQVLLNILQARERLPRHYMVVSGISDAPTATYNGSLNLSPVGLGSPGGELENSTLNLSGNWKTAPSYGVTPMGSENLARAFYAPLSASRFEYFWRTGWSTDILVRLFAESVVEGRCDSLSADTIFQAGEIQRATRTTATREGDCVFVGRDAGDAGVDRLVGRLVGETGKVIDLTDADGSAPLAAGPGSTDAALVRFRERDCGEAGPCSYRDFAAFVFRAADGAADIHVMDLRSLDQTIYFLGQVLRPDRMVYVASDDGAARVPLFMLHDRLPCDYADEEFAAGLDYRGRSYWAGAPWPRSRGGRTCADTAGEDRSGTVLTLLTQLYALGASTEALAPPGRFRLD